jgi:hypothetical protein
MSEPKYRPSLAANEIHYIISLVQNDTEHPELAQSVLAKLKLFVAKMNLGIVSPAFCSTARQSIEQRLGIDVSVTVSPLLNRELAFNKWQKTPELCSAAEIKLAQTYRYENDLMTQDEESEYESRT